MPKKLVSAIFILVAAAIAAAQPTSTATQATAPKAPPHTNLKVGDAAPDFTLPSTIVQDGKRQRYKLSDFRGKKNVVLAFYVFAFTGG